MVSKRLKLIASLINEDDKVLDIGTDHALLPIYLIKNNITSVADASDVNNIIIDRARLNVIKYDLEDKINLFVSDGVKSIDTHLYNTFIIAGMGYFTIESILSSAKLDNISKLIIQTNNNYDLLRVFMNKLGYKIVNEYYIKDQDVSYIIIHFEKGKQELSDIEIKCGIYNKNNVDYYKEQYDCLDDILKKISSNQVDKIEEINQLLGYYKTYLSKEKIED